MQNFKKENDEINDLLNQLKKTDASIYQNNFLALWKSELVTFSQMKILIVSQLELEENKVKLSTQDVFGSQYVKEEKKNEPEKEDFSDLNTGNLFKDYKKNSARKKYGKSKKLCFFDKEEDSSDSNTGNFFKDFNKNSAKKKYGKSKKHNFFDKEEDEEFKCNKKITYSNKKRKLRKLKDIEGKENTQVIQEFSEKFDRYHFLYSSQTQDKNKMILEDD